MSHEAFYQTIQYNDSRLHLNVEHVKQYLDENILCPVVCQYNE